MKGWFGSKPTNCVESKKSKKIDLGSASLTAKVNELKKKHQRLARIMRKRAMEVAKKRMAAKKQGKIDLQAVKAKSETPKKRLIAKDSKSSKSSKSSKPSKPYCSTLAWYKRWWN